MTPDDIRQRVVNGINDVLNSRLTQRFINEEQRKLLLAVQKCYQNSDATCAETANDYNALG